MSRQERRSFSREFKLAVTGRLEAGESGSALALETGVKRTIIYRWRDKWRAGGELALRSEHGRPTKADALALEAARGPAAKGPTHAARSPSWSARWASSSCTWIFSKAPCGVSRRRVRRAWLLARRRLRRDPGDDGSARLWICAADFT